MDMLLMLAVFPAVVLLYFVYKKDPVEKESPRVLGILFLCGMASVIPAIVLEIFGTNMFLPNGTAITLPQVVFDNFVIVALVEESCKFVFLRWRTWKDHAFNYIFDGIVYAVFVGLGFAVFENIMYVFSYGIGTALVRAFTAIPGHAIFAVFMGYFYGLAKYADAHGDAKGRQINTVLAIVVPILLHGSYDLFATLGDGFALLLFFALLIGSAFAAYSLINKLAKDATKIDDEGVPLTDVKNSGQGMAS